MPRWSISCVRKWKSAIGDNPSSLKGRALMVKIFQINFKRFVYSTVMHYGTTEHHIVLHARHFIVAALFVWYKFHL